ncbi:DUF1501 domain-containing protein [Alienimonas chondri]|uniref:DUF1501 domain-containing protein n=1 Tax=Alienimonas chondri TaxID=2681879 RepID=A0ABX1VES4_9PLAN|nr:DUF1501 domain-containing protein [Alienimonas chondri]NNJ26283.1 hypothetical protein [Alienimonas chondri]
MNATPLDHFHRRRFLGATAGLTLGLPAIGSLLAGEPGRGGEAGAGLPHFPPKAKRVIYLMQSGGPSHVDLFDDKETLRERRGEELPESVLQGLRQTTMTAGQSSKPCLPAAFGGRRRGESGMWVGDLLPHTAEIVDDLCFIRSLHGEQINHAPAVTQMLTGHNQPGRPSLGAWLTYGLGSTTDELPSFVVMTSKDRENTCGQLFYDYYWGAGFLPGKYQGVPFRGAGDPVLYLSNPAGVAREDRRATLDRLAALNQLAHDRYHDPAIETRIAQYEMAFKMQASVPDLVDFADEPQSVLDLYGPDVQRKGSYAHNCLMARRLIERGTQYVQLMHAGWDQHGNLPTQLPNQCRDTDQPSAGLVKDLKLRGLLEDTLVIWGGEFGRTPYVQGDITNKNAHGRDHHPRAFTIWMAGGGVKPGAIYGRSDEFAFHVAENPVHVRDLQATVLHLCGIDHERFTHRHQGLDFKLTGVEPARVVREILA